jgi:hypothetical protein
MINIILQKGRSIDLRLVMKGIRIKVSQLLNFNIEL